MWVEEKGEMKVEDGICTHRKILSLITMSNHWKSMTHDGSRDRRQTWLLWLSRKDTALASLVLVYMLYHRQYTDGLGMVADQPVRDWILTVIHWTLWPWRSLCLNLDTGIKIALWKYNFQNYYDSYANTKLIYHTYFLIHELFGDLIKMRKAIQIELGLKRFIFSRRQNHLHQQENFA